MAPLSYPQQLVTATSDEPRKLASVVARELEDEIVDARRPSGTLVGSEADLLDRFGVSRGVLREALRIVEHDGFATMRRGPGGGLVVGDPSRAAVVTAFSTWFSYVGVGVDEMLAARAPILGAICRLAADRVDERGIARLRQCLDEVDRAGALREEAFVAVDRVLGELSGNPVLALFAEAIGEIGLVRLRGTRARIDPPVSITDAAAHLDGYRRVADAIVRGDGGIAETRMVRLVEVVRTRMHEWPAQPRHRPPALDGRPGRLAERVAAAVRDDIERAGWPVGHVLGAEAELLERYGVSRSTMREAMRILEHLGAVRTKRGPGGGLVVTEPDGQAIIRGAHLALEHAQISTAQLFEARVVVELACVPLAVGHVHSPTAERLVLAADADAHAGQPIDAYSDVHRLLAEASGNRVLVLFIDVLAALTTRRAAGSAQRGTVPEAGVADVHTAHRRIVDAVISGDAALAQHRLRRHLAAVAAAIG